MGECRRTHRLYHEDGRCMVCANGRYRGTCIPMHQKREPYYETRLFTSLRGSIEIRFWIYLTWVGLIPQHFRICAVNGSSEYLTG